MDLFLGFEVRVVPPTVATAPGLLTPPAAAGETSTILGRGRCSRRRLRLRLLRLLTERELGQCRHLLAQRNNLRFEVDHPRPKELVLSSESLRFDPPKRCIVLVGGHAHQRTRFQRLCPGPPDPGELRVHRILTGGVTTFASSSAVCSTDSELAGSSRRRSQGQVGLSASSNSGLFRAGHLL